MAVIKNYFQRFPSKPFSFIIPFLLLTIFCYYLLIIIIIIIFIFLDKKSETQIYWKRKV